MSTKSKTMLAIQDFYKKKAKYDNAYNNAKNRILKSDSTISQKREKLKKIKTKCLACKRPVGTKFSIKNKHLLIKCGDNSDPCPLDIDINRGDFRFIPPFLKATHESLEIIKTDIVKIKLEILFGLSSEEDIEEQFSIIKDKYINLKTLLKDIESYLLENSLVEIQQIGGERIISKKELNIIQDRELKDYIKEFRILIKSYENSEAPDKKSIIMDECITLYIEKIIPLLEKIRNNLYEFSDIIVKDKIFKLVQIKTLLQNMELMIIKPSIVKKMK